MLTPGTILQNRYRIVSLLGQDGMGAVYRAWDARLNVPVAVKEMTPQPGLDAQTLAQLRQQFGQEATVLARLNHPNLVRVTDFFEESGNAYLVMDFVEGQSLADLIARQGALPEAQVLGWAAQLLDGLAYCHRQGVIHRDIKPQNVIIRPDGRAVLVDFGLVKLWDPRDPRTRTVVRGMGTPEYAPPEQWGAGHTNPRSDLYSLGATLYHALTGQAPPTTTDRIVNPASFLPLRRLAPRVSPSTEAVVLRAMELQPDARFGSAEEMAQALGGQAVVFPSRPLHTPPPPRRGKGRLGVVVGVVGGVVGLLCIAGLIGLALGQQRMVAKLLAPGAEVQATATARPEAARPVLTDIPVPRPAAAISPQNAGRVAQLARWGKGTVNRVAWSPDGRLLAVASSLGIYLYDAQTLEEVRFIETDSWVASVAFSPDGQTLASESWDGTVRLWGVR